MVKCSTLRDGVIDYWRGISIIWITLCHAIQVNPSINAFLYNILYIGMLGCQFFFFYSGMMMNKKGYHGSYFQFFIKKILGICFPWYVMLFFYYALSKIFSQGRYVTNTAFKDILLNIFFLNAFVPSANNTVIWGGWFVGTLVVMWALFPLFYHIGKINKNILLIIEMLCIGVMAIIGLEKGYDSISRNSFWYFSPLNQLPCFLYGMYFEQCNKNRYKAIRLLVVLLCILGLFYYNGPFCAIMYPTLTAIFAGDLTDASREYIKSDHKIINWFGQNSYYVFLTQYVFVWYLQDLIVNYLSNTALCHPTLAFVLLLPAEFFGIYLFSSGLKMLDLKIKKLIYNIFYSITRKLNEH